MGILYLINSNLKFKSVVKDRLFYNQYNYCIGFYLDEVSCLRELNHQYIDGIIVRRKQWREISLQRWNVTQSNKHIITRRSKEITDETVANLHELTDILLRSRVDFKLITSVSQAWVYTNNVELIEELSQFDFLIGQQYTQAVVNRPKNTIKLRAPTHRFRSYLRSIKLTDEEKVCLINFFKNQTDIRISPALTRWIEDRWYRTQDYFFVDHDSEAWLLMLALVKPGMIRKTSALIAG
jgi:hypothetical protein